MRFPFPDRGQYCPFVPIVTSLRACRVPRTVPFAQYPSHHISTITNHSTTSTIPTAYQRTFELYFLPVCWTPQSRRCFEGSSLRPLVLRLNGMICAIGRAYPHRAWRQLTFPGHACGLLVECCIPVLEDPTGLPHELEPADLDTLLLKAPQAS